MHSRGLKGFEWREGGFAETELSLRLVGHGGVDGRLDDGGSVGCLTGGRCFDGCLDQLLHRFDVHDCGEVEDVRGAW